MQFLGKFRSKALFWRQFSQQIHREIRSIKDVVSETFWNTMLLLTILYVLFGGRIVQQFKYTGQYLLKELSLNLTRVLLGRCFRIRGWLCSFTSGSWSFKGEIDKNGLQNLGKVMPMLLLHSNSVLLLLLILHCRY